MPASKSVSLGVGLVMLFKGVTEFGKAVIGTSVRLDSGDKSATTTLIIKGPAGIIFVSLGPEGTARE